ncbi:hypothetical protein C2G38_2031303 [Gigaspora rosea]|uniref:RZ-type domain-containing protein n=1 Tax=Gigaspora rosea TaxID=44941 RepID=A0A397VUT7_9GLOM|nr:hypothetical protein C2G38_2031303 [Gigaspora rosea]
MNAPYYTNSPHNHNETQYYDNEVEQPLNKIKPAVKFLPENVIWDGSIEVTDIEWTVIIMKPSTGLPTYPTSVIDFSDGKISERDIQWPDNNNDVHDNKSIVINYDNIEFNDKSIVINDNDIEFSEKSIVINDDDIEFSDKSIVINNDDKEFSDKSIVINNDKEFNDKSIVINNDDKEFIDKSTVINDDDIELSDKPVVVNNDEKEFSDKPVVVNNDDKEFSDKSVVVNNDDKEFSDKSIVINDDDIEFSDKPVVINDDDIEFSDKSVMINDDDIEFSDKSVVINDDDIEFSDKSVVINDDDIDKTVVINDDDIEFSENHIQFKEMCTQAESFNSIDELYGGLNIPEYPESVNEMNGWSESSHTVQSKCVIDQNPISNGIHYESRSHYTVTRYTRRRRRPRSYLEQRKDPRYNPDTDHWKNDATFLSFHDQERIDPLKRENEKHDAVIQAALDAWSANKDVTMEVFKTKPTKDTRSNSEIFDEDDRGDIVPPTISYSQTDTSPLFQALYEGNIAQANSVAKYLDGFKIDLLPILSIKLPDDIEIEVRQNSKWPAYYVGTDKNVRRYSCEETIKKALYHIIHSRVAIINAAPVTSEVLLITKAVQLLSEPLNQRNISAPIIVITKSSLTLDKILTELLSIFPNLIRVGSTKQCKNRLLAGRQVDNLQNEISTLYNRQIDHLKDTRIDLLKRIRERFTFMSDDCFLQSAPGQFKRQLVHHKGKKANSPSRDVDLKALKAWLSNDYSLTSDGNRSPITSFEESTIRRPFKCFLNKTPLQKILSANMENLFDNSPDDLYSAVTLPVMFSLIEELENILSFDDDANDLNNIYSSNIDELRFINNLISRLPQDQMLLFNKKNQPEKFPNDLKNDINQFWRHINITNIWKMPTNDRKLYRNMFNRIISNYYDPVITNIYTGAMKLNSSMDVKRLQKLSDVMKGAPVIGFSWKNAKCLKKLFHDSSPASAPVFIVDEASEIPEDEIKCIIRDNEDLEHLVMIGDMGRTCGNSLFERWISNGGRHYRLSEQCRVHPDINSLLSTFYKRISDDLSFLKNNSKIPGTTSNVYFLNHQNYDEVPDGISKKMINTIEAEFVAKFTFYLHQQDVDFDPGNITILTPFTDQKELIKRLLAPELTKEKTVKIREIITKEIGMHNYEPEFAQKIIVTEKKLGAVNVQLINDYRYEENQIVILSLVAVPQRLQQEALATLSTKDLVYTALSRANRGLYIFGDGDVLKNIPIWNSIIKKTMEEKTYGSELILSCQNHGIRTKISHPNHFEQHVPLGGCVMSCEKMLLCGHECPRKCHPIPHSQERNRFKCEKPCQRKSKIQIENRKSKRYLHDFNECSHPCERKCYECYEEGSCGTCEEEILWKFTGCGHEVKIKCHERRQHKLCEELVPSDKLKCGHSIEKIPCHQRHNVDEYKCRKAKDVEIPTCGHMARVPCFVTNPECTKRCGYKLSCGHECEEGCAAHKNHIHRRSDCKRECPKTLVCGHKCINGCAEPDQHSSSCMEECTFKCLHGVGCPFQCYEPCFECLEDCPLKCEHSQCTKRCFEDCDRHPCNKSCAKILKCGHACNGLCGEPCPPCKKCNPNIECPITLTKIGEFSDDERCYMLPDCRCVFMVDALDQYFRDKPSVNGHLVIKLWDCPCCKQLVYTAGRYNKFIKEAVRMWNVVKLQKKQNELTEEEKEQIIQAMDSEIQELYGDGDNVTGHWFCCPNGHPYYIGECGGATQRSVCNDCGAIIGGTGHIVVPSNSFYGEFDGSAAPAYPGQPGRQPNR